MTKQMIVPKPPVGKIVREVIEAEEACAKAAARLQDAATPNTHDLAYNALAIANKHLAAVTEALDSVCKKSCRTCRYPWQNRYWANKPSRVLHGCGNPDCESFGIICRGPSTLTPFTCISHVQNIPRPDYTNIISTVPHQAILIQALDECATICGPLSNNVTAMLHNIQGAVMANGVRAIERLTVLVTAFGDAECETLREELDDGSEEVEDEASELPLDESGYDLSQSPPAPPISEVDQAAINAANAKHAATGE